jgi:hypothetical protein
LHDGPPPPTASVEDGQATLSLRRWARRWSGSVIAVWLACSAAVIVWIITRGVAISGDVEALLPVHDRSLVDEPLVLLTLREDAPAESASSDTLIAAAALVADRLGSERVPLAPPAGEAAAWFDAHALFLVPDDALADLRARLADDAMSAAVEDLRARLSSPLFGVGDDEPRRDPLALRGAIAGAGGRFGPADTLGKARATASGDLVDRHGTGVLVQLRSERPAADLLADVVGAIGDAPVDAALVGPAGIEAAAREVVAARHLQVFVIAAAGLALVLAAALRRVRATAAILACLATALAAALVWQPVIDAWSVPMLVLFAGFACEGALHLQRISARGWPAAAVLATALVPLALGPYPVWERWAWSWALAIAVAVLLLRVVLPAIHARVGGDTSWEGRGFRWTPMPITAVLLSGAILGAGAWASSNVRYRGGDRVTLAPASAAQARLLDEFFDPALVVRTASSGSDHAAALERAALDARTLATLVPVSASRVDSPGSLVMRTEDIESRRVALAELELPKRMMRLREILESRGFRADAFGEFLRTARVDEAGPTAGSMLDGPLGAWLRRYQITTAAGPTFRSFVHLDADAEAELPPPLATDAGKIRLSGPAAAARRDRSEFQNWFGIWALTQMWIGAFVVWVGTRSFTIAMSAAFATLVTQCATLVAMAALRLPIGPQVLPGILLVGAAATIAAARACRAIDLRKPLFATGLIVTSLCQSAAAIALIATDVPAWRQLGIVVVIGAATASGVGLFVAPGLCRALRRFGRGEAEPADEDPGGGS